MKKAKIPQKRIIARLKMLLLYINTRNVIQREALDTSARYSAFTDDYMQLVALDKGRTLGTREIKSGPKNNS